MTFWKIFLVSLFILNLSHGQTDEIIKLPSFEKKGNLSLEETIVKRRSVRQYSNEKLSMKELGQLLWAAQGITSDWGGRSAPSAGATYPLEIYVVAGNVENLQTGLYQYLPQGHSLKLISNVDLRNQLTAAAFGQHMIKNAPATIVIAADFARTTRRYGNRGIMYVHIEVGHSGQNIYLQAEALDLGTVAIGAFDEKQVKNLLGIKENPLYIMPVGRKGEK